MGLAPDQPAAQRRNNTTATFQKVWGTIQHELIYLAWSLMDIALLAPFGLVFMGWARFWPAGQVFLWLWFVLLIPFNLIRLMSLLSVDPERQRQVMVISLLITIILTWRNLLYQADSWLDWSWLRLFYDNLASSQNLAWTRDLTVFLLTAVAWWRGIHLASRQFHIKRAGLRLRLGSLLIMPLVFTLYYGPHGHSAVPFLFLFFGAGLTALALIRAEEVEQADSGLSASLSPRWLLVIFVVALLTIFTGGAITTLITGKAAGPIMGLLSPGLVAITIGLMAVINTVTYLGTPLINLIAIIIDVVASWLNAIYTRVGFDTSMLTTPDSIFMPTAKATEEIIDVVTITPPNLKLLSILIMLSCVLIIALALGRLYRQATIAARDSQSAYGQTTIATPNLGQRLLQRLGLWRNWQTAASVRRIYQQMCDLAAHNGYPRAEFETPYEYQKTLEQIWPENLPDSHLITLAYVRVRYGELPETDAELDAIKQAFKRLENVKVLPLASSEITLSQRL